MTGSTLAAGYSVKARQRLRALGTWFEDEAFSDVVREAQELVELALSGIRRACGGARVERARVAGATARRAGRRW